MISFSQNTSKDLGTQKALLCAYCGPSKLPKPHFRALDHEHKYLKTVEENCFPDASANVHGSVLLMLKSLNSLSPSFLGLVEPLHLLTDSCQSLGYGNAKRYILQELGKDMCQTLLRHGNWVCYQPISMLVVGTNQTLAVQLLVSDSFLQHATVLDLTRMVFMGGRGFAYPPGVSVLA